MVAGRIGRDYSYPFGDASVIPTNVLAHATIDEDQRPSAVIEGTGADGSFAVPCAYRQWRRLYSVPLAARAHAGEWYRHLHLWRSHRAPARWMHTIRRSAQLPLESAALAGNGLDGIAYDTPPAIESLLQDALRERLDAVLPGAEPDARFGMLDVVLACAGAMAPKTFDPLRAHGVMPVYPYLSPSVVYGAALLPLPCQCRDGEPKALLKSLLARELPAALVYRAKRGFTPPYRRIFSSPAMQRVLHERVLDSGNRLLDFCRADVVRRMLDDASRGHLSTAACNFLWALAFASIWLTQVRDASFIGPRTTPRTLESCAGFLVS
jgi:asparagine synthetase B (glutamine-hydrolysing)